MDGALLTGGADFDSEAAPSAHLLSDCVDAGRFWSERAIAASAAASCAGFRDPTFAEELLTILVLLGAVSPESSRRRLVACCRGATAPQGPGSWPRVGRTRNSQPANQPANPPIQHSPTNEHNKPPYLAQVKLPFGFGLHARRSTRRGRSVAGRQVLGVNVNGRVGPPRTKVRRLVKLHRAGRGGCAAAQLHLAQSGPTWLLRLHSSRLKLCTVVEPPRIMAVTNSVIWT